MTAQEPPRGRKGCTFRMPGELLLLCQAPALKDRPFCYFHDPEQEEKRLASVRRLPRGPRRLRAAAALLPDRLPPGPPVSDATLERLLRRVMKEEPAPPPPPRAPALPRFVYERPPSRLGPAFERLSPEMEEALRLLTEEALDAALVGPISPAQAALVEALMPDAETLNGPCPLFAP